MLPSIFNDVIGPIMRGPSSSHTAASWRIASVCLDILNEPLKKALIEFDKEGAWAPNFEEQGTVMGINGGLLGLEITDPRMKNTDKVIEERAFSISYKIGSFKTNHVNSVRLTLEGIKGNKIQVLAASLGGGSFEIQEINNSKLSIRGDYYELLLLKKETELSNDVRSLISYYLFSEEMMMINLKSSESYPLEYIDQLKLSDVFESIITIEPILPIVSGKDKDLPFTTINSLLKFAAIDNSDLGDLGIHYEHCLSGLSKTELLDKMKEINHIIEKSIETGLAGTNYEDRILPQQSHLIKQAEKKGSILADSVLNKIISNVTAIMEVKSAMEIFVANPTAGSCGTVGGVIKAIADELESTEEEITKAYFAAGMIGVYFATGPGFSAEEHGCQVECGAASGMAAAAIVQLLGGTAKQAINAASMAIQNMIGLICDPVADRVEVPCLGKNISAAMNAYASATMICSGFDRVIPLDEVILTVSKVSQQMPTCVKCTGKGGLAITKTALHLKTKLK